jgi:hypothetical protein
MARPRDTLRPCDVVVNELWRRFGDHKVALQFLNEDLRSGVRVAFHDGAEKPPSYWTRAQIKLDPLDPYIELDGASVGGEFLISAPEPLPLEVKLVPIAWLTKLLHGMGSLVRGKAESAAPPAEAPIPIPETSQIDWRNIWRYVPQKPGEKDVDYLHRFYEAMPKWFQGRHPYKTVSNRYYDTGPGRK